MKINDSIILDKTYINIDDKIFGEGDILEGTILTICDNIATIKFEKIGVLKAIIKNDLKLYSGIKLKFSVKSLSTDKLQLEPIFENVKSENNMGNIYQVENSLTNILDEVGIERNSIHMELLQNLMKYNFDINKHSITRSIGMYNKIEELLNIGKEQKNIIIKIGEKNHDIGAVDIEEILVNSNEEIELLQTKYDMVNKNDLISAINNSFPKKYSNIKFKSDLIKVIVFFIKFNIKPTLNNFKYMFELEESFFAFSEDFKILEKILSGKKFTNFFKMSNIDDWDNNILINYNRDSFKRYLDKIEKIMKENNLFSDKQIKHSIKELKNKLEFINEMNKKLLFTYLPFNINENYYQGLITFLKERKKNTGFKGKINIFINLKTKRLGEVEISCHATGDLMDIKFINIDEQDLNLFKLWESLLKDEIKLIGYNVRTIKYLYADAYSILDSLIINKNPTYFLNIKV